MSAHIRAEKPLEWLGLDETKRRAYELLNSLSDDREPDTQRDIELIVAALKDVDGWQPIETADKIGVIWLSDGGSMRLGFWMEGEEFEHHGSKGGGWRDHASAENFKHGWDLHFAPTHWRPTPGLPKVPAPSREDIDHGRE